jgi:hypothetical protein
LLGELDRIVNGHRYPLSPRFQILKAIRAKIRPEPTRESLPITKKYEAPSKGRCPETRLSSYSGPPATLGSTAAAHMRLIVRCGDYRHQVEPDPGELAERHGAEMTVPDWRERLVRSQCGSRDADMVVTGTNRQ